LNLRELYTLVTGIMLIVLLFAMLSFVDNSTLASDFRNELYRFDFYADHHHGLYDKHTYLPLIMQGGPIGTSAPNDIPTNTPVRVSSPTSTDTPTLTPTPTPTDTPTLTFTSILRPPTATLTPTPAGNSTSISSVVPLVIPQESGGLPNLTSHRPGDTPGGVQL
jgi:hypothetical protein